MAVFDPLEELGGEVPPGGTEGVEAGEAQAGRVAANRALGGEGGVEGPRHHRW